MEWTQERIENLKAALQAVGSMAIERGSDTMLVFAWQGFQAFEAGDYDEALGQIRALALVARLRTRGGEAR